MECFGKFFAGEILGFSRDWLLCCPDWMPGPKGSVCVGTHRLLPAPNRRTLDQEFTRQGSHPEYSPA